MSRLVVISRTIFRRADAAEACLVDLMRTGALEQIRLGDAGWLFLERPVDQVGSSSTWHARARLKGRRPRWARSITIEISLTGWSSRASELSLRPTARHPGHWGARRLSRYFDLAHLAGDQLAALLQCPDPAEMNARGSSVTWDLELSAAA